jgi:hypothetical protein
VAIALLLFALAGPAAAAAKTVVLLPSFGQDFKPWSKYARVISQRTEAVGASLPAHTVANHRSFTDENMAVVDTVASQLNAVKPREVG